MSATLDVNVLIYATNSADPAHETARELVDRLAAGPDLLYVFWPTLMGYLRIGTHPAILPRPLAPRDAIANLSDLLALPHVRSPGEAEGFWELFRATAGDTRRGDDVPDAHLATLMRQHGVGVIYTRDRGFRRFEGIDIRDPFG
ncbi:MAG: TA system VapC family ribonuclease toxin [Thermoleophilaceae bacterium]